jgi:phage shock protein A
MTLLHRIHRLFQADLHGVLDEIEEPDLLLKQSLREMEEEIAREEAALAGLDHQARALEEEAETLGSEAARIDGRLDLCFADSDETLARSVVRQKLACQRAEEALGRERRRLLEERQGRAERLTTHQAQLAQLRQRCRALERAPGAGAAAGPGWGARFGIGAADPSPEEVELAFREECQRRRTGAPG